MNISAIALLAAGIILSGCSMNGNGFISRFHGTVMAIHEYKEHCLLGLENGMVDKVDITDCKNLEIGDKVSVIRTVEGTNESARVKKLNQKPL